MIHYRALFEDLLALGVPHNKQLHREVRREV
jgi:hypothetical protein